jgi:hypothetical protein
VAELLISHAGPEACTTLDKGGEYLSNIRMRTRSGEWVEDLGGRRREVEEEDEADEAEEECLNYRA